MASLQELELDEISEWPLLPQLVVILLIMLLIQGAGYWFYLMPKQDEIALLKQEEETVKATLRIKANKVAVLPQIQAQLDELKERYDFYCASYQCKRVSQHAGVSQPAWAR